VIPGFPAIDLSPNDAYRNAIPLRGYVAAPSDPDLFLELLPTAWCKIHAGRLPKQGRDEENPPHGKPADRPSG